MSKEIWKPILGYVRKYEVSNLGRIRSLIGRRGERLVVPFVLKRQFDINGYEKVQLYRDGQSQTFGVHRIVAIAFFGMKIGQVHHRDQNKINNSVGNLQWVSRSKNVRLSVRTQCGVRSERWIKKALVKTKAFFGDFTQEKWKPCLKHGDRYHISSCGRVRFVGVDPFRIRKAVGGTRYFRVSVKLPKVNKFNYIQIHREVAIAFVPYRRGANQVNHIDGNKGNNRFDNLEWVTSKENHAHAVKIGHRARGKDHWFVSLTVRRVRLIRRMFPQQNITQLSRRFKVSRSCIRQVINRKSWAWLT